MAQQILKRQSGTLQRPESSIAGVSEVAQSNAQLTGAIKELANAARPAAQRATAQQAQEKGRKAAQAGEFEPRKDGSFASAEYNRAGLNVTLSNIELQMRDDIDGMFEQQKHDPAALENSFNKYRQSLEQQLGQNFEQLIPEVQQMFARVTKPLSKQSAANYERVLLSTNTAKAAELLERRINDGERISRASFANPEMLEDLHDEQDLFEATLVGNGPKEGFTFNGVEYDPDPSRSGSFSPEEMEQLSQDWSEKMEVAHVIGGFDQATDKEKYVDDWEAAEQKRKGSPFSLPQIDTIAQRMRSEINRDRAKVSAEEKRLKKLVSEAEKVFGDGRTPAGLIGLQKAVQPFPELSTRLMAAKQNAGAVAEFNKLHPAIQDQVLNKMQLSKEVTPQQNALMNLLEKAQTQTQQLLDKDPVQLLPRHGIEIPNADLSNPTTWNHRDATANQLEAMYRIDHHGFTADEVKAIDNIITNNTVEANIDYMLGMQTTMDPDHMVKLLTDIAPKQPELAAAAGLTDVRPDLSEQILRGSELMKDPQIKGILPPINEINPVIDEVLGDTVTGNNRKMIVQAAIALDVSRRQAAGRLSSSEFDSDALEDAVLEITGGVYEFNGKKIIAPAHDVDEDEFEDLIDSMVGADIGSMRVNRQRVDIETFREHAVLHNDTHGTYLVSFAGGFAQDENGDPFVLDLGNMVPTLRARRAKPRTLRGFNIGAPAQQ